MQLRVVVVVCKCYADGNCVHTRDWMWAFTYRQSTSEDMKEGETGVQEAGSNT